MLFVLIIILRSENNFKKSNQFLEEFNKKNEYFVKKYSIEKVRVEFFNL